MMDKQQLDAIRARCDGATLGPWNRHDKDDYAEIHNSDTYGKFFSPIALVEYGEDADFIASSRTDIPALLAEVERLKDDNARLTARCEAMTMAMKSQYPCGLCKHDGDGPFCFQCDRRTNYCAFEFNESRVAAKEDK